MTVSKILSSLMIEKKSIDIRDLPSQGYFYKPDMKLRIKKAETEDILEYEKNINRHNVIVSIDCIKAIVERNTILNRKYTYSDIKSVDIIFIFLEIVKFTKSGEFMVKYKNSLGEEKKVAFGIENFNYFDFSPFMQFYDSNTREFVMDGWRYSFPCIGVENSLSKYLLSIKCSDKIESIKNISYSFLFFLTGRNNISIDEVENIINIFNFDIEESDKKAIDNIISKFSPVLSYSLKVNGYKIDMRSSMDLESIWNL